MKLLGEVALERRQEPLFADFLPHYGEFVKRLKRGD